MDDHDRKTGQYLGDDRFTPEGKSLAQLLLELSDDEMGQLPDTTYGRLLTLFRGLSLAARAKQLEKVDQSILGASNIRRRSIAWAVFGPMISEEALFRAPREQFIAEMRRRADRVSGTDQRNRLIDLILRSQLELGEIREEIGRLLKRRGTIKAQFPETVVRLSAGEQWPLLEKLRSAFRVSVARITETVNRSRDADAVERYNKYLFENFRPMMRLVL